MINWDALSKEEIILIDKIVKRAFNEMTGVWLGADMFSVNMDIAGAHIDTPLKLQELLESPLRDFAHDVAGIISHFNRVEKRLMKGFCPRYAQPELKSVSA